MLNKTAMPFKWALRLIESFATNYEYTPSPDFIIRLLALQLI